MSSYGTISQTKSTMPAEVILQNAATGTGNGTSLPVSGFATAILSITGTFVATVAFEGSVDDTTWVSLLATKIGTTTTATSDTSTGDWALNVVGYKSVRARVSAFTSGSVTVIGYVSVLAGMTGAGGVTQSGTWAVQLLDSGGTNKASISAGGAVKVDASSATVPVSGTFWQATQPVSGTFWQATQPVSGTFWQATQPISAAALPLPSGAAQDSTLTGGTAKFKLIDSGGTNVASVSSGGAVKVDASSATVPVSGTFWQATQPVSGTFWQATQPVSGTFWQATQPISAAALPLPSGAAQDSTLTGGSLKAICRGGAKGSTTAADVTSSSVDDNHNALDVYIRGGGGGVVGAVTQSGTWLVALTVTGASPTYRAATGLFTPATSATDMAGIFWNTSSGKTIRILAIYLNYTAAAQSAANNFYLIKRSTINTSGTAVTAVTQDYNNYSNAAATALVKYWTSNPTLGTTIGTMEVVTLTPYSSVNANPPARKQVLYEAEPGSQGIVIRQGNGSGTAQEGLVINNNGSTVANASAQVGFTFVWTEE